MTWDQCGCQEKSKARDQMANEFTIKQIKVTITYIPYNTIHGNILHQSLALLIIVLIYD